MIPHVMGSVRSYWEAQAATFDDEPDHGLLDPSVRDAWQRLLCEFLPPAPANVIDLGCGTGTLSVLLAESGYRVRGLDLATAMVTAAMEKAQAACVLAEFQQGDASDPPFEPASADVVLSRHVLWAMPDPSVALGRWCRLLRPDGRLLLIEGRWFTGAGIHAAECERLIREHRENVIIRPLDDETLWARTLTDERYIAVSTR